MKVKMFKISLMSEEKQSEDMFVLNTFLEINKIDHLESTLVSGSDMFWSVMVFYGLKKELKKKEEWIVLTEKEKIIADHIRNWRKQEADKDGTPPYIILNSKTIRNLARANVINKFDLLDVNGVGQKKMERYGDQIMGILNMHREVSIEDMI